MQNVRENNSHTHKRQIDVSRGKLSMDASPYTSHERTFQVAGNIGQGFFLLRFKRTGRNTDNDTDDIGNVSSR